MTRVYISMGSNLGDRKSYMLKALKLLSQLEGVKILKRSDMYETDPECKTDQPKFLNCVVELETILEPDTLLGNLQEIEDILGRTRKEKWGPRTVDLDMLTYDQKIIKTERLSIPHPLMKERRFVLMGLCELNPDFIIPGQLSTVRDLLQSIA